MATLGKIRNHGVLLLIVIGVALLIFIVTDFASNGSAFFRNQNANVGVIDGDNVKYSDFYEAIARTQDFYRIEYGQNSLTDDQSEAIRQDVWNQYVTEQVVKIDAEKIGMTVSKQELSDLTIGKSVSPIISMRKMFANQETGAFDPNMVVQLITNLDNPQLTANNSEQIVTMRNYWKFLEGSVKSNSLIQKYNTLLSKSLTTNSLEAKEAYDNSKTSVNLIYALKPYYSIPDSTIEVSDKELKEFYEKDKNKYKQEPSVDISYVIFPIAPSAEDFEAVQNSVNSIKDSFAIEKEQNLMDFVNIYSDVPFVDVFLTKDEVASDLQAYAFSGSSQMYGPVLKDNVFKMARIAQTALKPDSVRLSVIVVQASSQKEIDSKVDSIMGAHKAGANFMQLAMQHSVDKPSAAKGGDLGWFRESMLTKEIVENAFLLQSNNTPFVIENKGHSQIFLATDRTKPVLKVKLAVIEKEVNPSNKTQSTLYQQAKTFAGEVKMSQNFADIAKKSNYFVQQQQNVDHNAPRLGSMARSREIIRWAFDNKEKSTSDVFECENNLVVATITHKNSKGYTAFDHVKSSLLNNIRNDKKFEKVKGDFAGKSIEQLMTEGFEIDSVSGLNFESRSAGRLGDDFALMATAPLASVGQVSEPIKGKTGIYVYKIVEKRENPVPFDNKAEIAKIASKNQNIFANVIEALKKAYKVKDERFRFY